jgi:hypothetical protein
VLSVQETLKTAIWSRRCVVMFAEWRRRDVCPHALGYQGQRLKVLVYQYSGGSALGLAQDGGWRCFSLDDIAWAEIIEGGWRTSPDYLIKAESIFKTIKYQVSARPGG